MKTNVRVAFESACLSVTLFVALAVCAIASVANADRTDVWDASTVNVYRVDLEKLPDGGCAVTAFATMSKQDGGVISDGTRRTEVSAGNRTDCLNIINVRAPVLFRADKDL